MELEETLNPSDIFRAFEDTAESDTTFTEPFAGEELDHFESTQVVNEAALLDQNKDGVPEVSFENEDDFDFGETVDDVLEQKPADMSTVKQKTVHPKLELQLFLGNSDSLLPEELRDPETAETKDAIWEFYVNRVSKFPAFSEVLKDTKEAIERKTGLESALGEEAVRKLQAGHLDRLLKMFRQWSQEVYPLGLGLLEFGKRMDNITHKHEFQEYRLSLIKRYKTVDLASLEQIKNLPPDGDAEMAAPHFDSSLFEEEDKESRAVSHLQLRSDQLEAIRQRREAAAKLKQRRATGALNNNENSDISRRDTETAVSLSLQQRERIEAAKAKALEKKRLLQTSRSRQE